MFLARIEAPLSEALLNPAPTGRHETVFVDDGSSDRTAERIIAQAETRPDIKQVRLSRTFGKDSAAQPGVRTPETRAIPRSRLAGLPLFCVCRRTGKSRL